jgi:general secretion pathway protein G
MLVIIVSLAVPSFTLTTENVKSEIHKTNLLKIERAVHLFFLDVGKYPDNLRDLVERPEGEENWRGPYMEEIPGYPNDSSLSYDINLNGKVLIK